MKKWIGCVLSALILVSLLTACGAKEPQPEEGTAPPETSGVTDSGEAEELDAGGAPASGAISYDQDALLQSYSDFVYAQGAGFEAVFNNMEALSTNFDLHFATLDRDYLVFSPTCDEYDGSGRAILGDPVTVTSNGDETTWEIEKETENDFGPNEKQGDIETIFISLNTNTNKLYTEQTRLRDGAVVSKTVNRVAVLADGTVLSEFYAAGPDGKGENTVSSASLFKYSAASQNFEMVHGQFLNVTADFTAPECLTTDGFDKSTFLTFANETGTVKVTAGVGEVILP